MADMPVTNQPMSASANMMVAPVVGYAVPPGLEYLTALDQLIVKQSVELLEAFTSFEAANTYTIFNSMGQKIYDATEDSNCCLRLICKKRRGFVMHITNNFRQEVFTAHRPFKLFAGYMPCLGRCCSDEVTVTSVNGEYLGNVRQRCSCLCPRYSVLDSQENTLLNLEGPCMLCMMCPNAAFKIMTPDSTTEVGVIKKQWGGLARELFTDADNFGVSFPINLEVRVKATLIGAIFLIDFNYFEDNAPKDKQRDSH